MLVVAGLTLKNLEPRVWDPESLFYMPQLRAVMVSYADFERRRSQRESAMALGLKAHLRVPPGTKVFLDNGSFWQMRSNAPTSHADYEEFVAAAKPDWWPIPQDFIPLPSMRSSAQRSCLERTMNVNREYERDGFTPVIHFGKLLSEYIEGVKDSAGLRAKPSLALGGLVPNLLRSRRAHDYDAIVNGLRDVRRTFAGMKVHVFGVGGTATIHLAALIGFDSVDSSGWRNRAARGIIQLPGSGDRVIANLGSWRGREPSRQERRALRNCNCPACTRFGVKGLGQEGMKGFANRASHNLWVLLAEAEWVDRELTAGTYSESLSQRLSNSTYLPLLQRLLRSRSESK